MKRTELANGIDRCIHEKSTKLSKTEQGATTAIHCSMASLAQFYHPLLEALANKKGMKVLQYSFQIFKTYVWVAIEGEFDKYHHSTPNFHRMALFDSEYTPIFEQVYSTTLFLNLRLQLVQLIQQSVKNGDYEKLNYLVRNMPPQYEWHPLFLDAFSINELEEILIMDEFHWLNMELIEAVRIENFDECQRLIRSGANVNVTQLLSDEPNSPLQIACGLNNIKICLLLLNQGANAYATDCNGLTALHYAIHCGDICELLIGSGANVNAFDLNGQTPIARLLESLFYGWYTQGSLAAVKVLLHHGANVNYTMIEYKTTPITYLLNSHKQETELNSEDLEMHRLFSETMIPYAMMIPGPDFMTGTDNNGSSIPTVQSALCSLKKFGIFKDLGHQILASNSFFRQHVLNILLPRIRDHATNNTLSLALKRVPVFFHLLVCEIICEYTIQNLGDGPYTADAIRSEFGKRIFQNIARQLNADFVVNPKSGQQLGQCFRH